MAGKFSVQFLKAAKDEYRHLDGSEKVFVDKAIARINYFGMACGQPLLGNLIGYRKLKNKKMGLRVVFGESKTGIEVIDIIAIGKRNEKQVYYDAALRVEQHHYRTQTQKRPRHN